MIIKVLLSALNFLFSLFTFNFDFSFISDIFDYVFKMLSTGISICFYFFHYPLVRVCLTFLISYFTFKIAKQIFDFVKSIFVHN